MNKNGSALTRLMSMLVMILIAVCVFGTVSTAAAFADEDEDRGFGNLYILGRKITASGEIPSGTVPHTGTITYDAASKTLSLSGVTLDLDDYYKPPETENNYAAAISAWGDLKIELDGVNKIKSSTNTYGEDKEYVYGVSNHSGKTEITGSGSLEITLDSVSGKSFTGIDASRDLIVSTSVIMVNIKGTQESSGIDLGISDFTISGAAKVGVIAEGEGSTAVSGSGLFMRSSVTDNAVLEMTGDGAAFRCYLASDELKETPAFVNTSASSEGAQAWDRTTGLYTYKYVRFQADEGGGGRASGTVYILGRKISESGTVPATTVPHKGTISFDKVAMTVTLTDATLDLNDFKSPAQGNIVAGLYATSGFDLVLKGQNYIISPGDDYARYGNGADKKEYVYGIEAWGPVKITGTSDSSLSISFAKTAKEANKSITMAGIDCDDSVTADTALLDIDMGSYGKSSGIFLWAPLYVKNGGRVLLNADGAENRAFNGVNAIGKSEIEDGSALEMISDGRAFNCFTPSDTLKNTPCVVNMEKSADGAAQWDKSTGLYEYKYVRYGNKIQPAPKPEPGPEPEPKPVVQKKANTLKATGKTVKIKYAKLKKKAQTIKRKKAITVSKAQGTVTYKLSSVSKSKYKKYFKVARNGNITVRKKLKKGKYTVKVKVTAKGNSQFKSGSKTVKVTVKVK